ncbi:hypothetical protein [Microbacterium sp.]|uniref:hypothetical protein n=1 Tax=Microbacterium sp. TaxID=51671 RepID=UPI0026386E5E|nr:hypothetical protein [Microbacterium sp.]
MGLKKMWAATLGTAVVAVAVLGGVAPADAASGGDLDQAFEDYINGVNTGIMTPDGNNQRWEFTYDDNGNDGLLVVETYVVQPPLPGGQSPYTYYGSDWVLDPSWKLPIGQLNPK